MNSCSYVPPKKTFTSGIVVSIAGFALTANALPPLVTVLARRFSIRPDLFGIIFLLQFISFTFFSSMTGYWFGRGRGKPVAVLTLTLLTAAAAVGTIGLASNILLLAGIMIIIGGCGGIVESTGTMILSQVGTAELVPPREADQETSDEGIPSRDPERPDILERIRHSLSGPGKLVHLSQMFYCLGALFAPMVIGTLLSRSFSVPVIGLTVGGIAAAVGLAVLVLVTERPGRQTLRNVAVSGHLKDRLKSVTASGIAHEDGVSESYSAAGQAAGQAPPPGSISGEAIPARHRFIWYLLMMFLYVMLEASLASWLPTYLETACGLTGSQAAYHLTLFWTGLAGSRFIYLFIRSQAIRTQLAIQISGIMLTVLPLLIPDLPAGIRAPLILLLGLACGPVWPLIINLYSSHRHRSHYVMYLVSAGSTGALAGIVVTSAAVSIFGIPAAMPVAAIYTAVLGMGYTGLTLGLRKEDAAVRPRP